MDKKETLERKNFKQENLEQMSDAPSADETNTPLTPAQRRRMLNVRENIKKLPDKKPHLDFLAALLTIPVLITVLILNLNNLKQTKTPNPTPTPTPVVKIISVPSNAGVTSVAATPKPQPTSDPNSCVKGIAPISIDFPSETQRVADNPVCIDINYQQGNFCSSVWAYSINGSNFSDYSNNSVCLYNLPAGNNTFTLNVKSLASSSTQTLTRHFTYNNPSTPTPSPTMSPVVSPSATP